MWPRGWCWHIQLQWGQPMGLFSFLRAKAGAQFWGDCFLPASAFRCDEPSSTALAGDPGWASPNHQGSQSTCGTAGCVGCRCPPHEGLWRACSQPLLLSPTIIVEGAEHSSREMLSRAGPASRKIVCHAHSFLSLGFFSSLFWIQVMCLWVMLV